LLRPCPGTPRCWIYRVRAGDNIYSIANYFGISQDSIYDLNPFVRNGLRPGQDLRLPPPTREPPASGRPGPGTARHATPAGRGA
jgi:LysM repeat protein